MELSYAQATLIREALALAAVVITGDLDGKRRVPWDAHGMNADDGDAVSAELTTEAGYWDVLNTLDNQLAAYIKTQ